MKSSKRGTTSLSLVTQHSSVSQEENGQNIESGDSKNSLTTSQAATSLTAPSQQKVSPYGWKPEYARMQNSFDPYENWLLSQAKSFLGRADVTVDDAKILFEEIDPSTRKLRGTPEKRRPVGLLAALRALVGGGIILLASGCVKVPESSAQIQQGLDVEVIATSYPAGVISKFYDRTEGVVCYTIVSTYDYAPAINCMVAKPGDGQ